MLTTEHLADADLPGVLYRDSLDGAELLQSNGLMHPLFYVMANAYFHYPKGVLDDEAFSGIRNQFHLMAGLRGVKSYWELRREKDPESFQRSFKEEIATELEDTWFAEYRPRAEQVEG